MPPQRSKLAKPDLEVSMTGRFLASSLVIVLAVLSVPAGAQSPGISISVPYEFTAGSRKLAAGEYLISRPIPTNPRVLGFRGDAKRQKVIVNTNPKTSEAPARDTELVFARYGDAYFLRTVSIRGAREVYEIPMSKAEKAAAAKGEAVMVTLKAEVD
jgi:hypothetical protein